MAKRKIKIKRIENAATREVTFSKRRGGLLKKAHDLSVLCDADVGVVIFSSKGKLFQFAHPSMQSVVERYLKTRGDSESPENVNSSTIHGDTDRLTQFTEKLTSLQSTLIGDDLEWLSLRDLIRLEQQMHDNLGRIRAKKEELFLEQLQENKEKMGVMRRAANVNLNMLEKMVDFGPGPSEQTGSQYLGAEGNNEHACAGGPPGRDSFFLFLQQDLNTRVYESNGTAEGLHTANRITEDLNRSPPCCEE